MARECRSGRLLGLGHRAPAPPTAASGAAAAVAARWYHKRVVDHYNNPRNVGSFDKNDSTVGTGLVGASACGDVMKLQIKVDGESAKIVDACFKTFGCGSAIASSSLGAKRRGGRTARGEEGEEIRGKVANEVWEGGEGEEVGGGIRVQNFGALGGIRVQERILAGREGSYTEFEFSHGNVRETRVRQRWEEDLWRGEKKRSSETSGRQRVIERIIEERLGCWNMGGDSETRKIGGRHNNFRMLEYGRTDMATTPADAATEKIEGRWGGQIPFSSSPPLYHSKKLTGGLKGEGRRARVREEIQLVGVGGGDLGKGPYLERRGSPFSPVSTFTIY